MSDELNENEVADVFPAQLNNEKLEYIYIGLLLNNPKAISVYYILHEDCHFQRKDLENIYKSIIFKEGESFAPPAAKEGYTLAVENAKTYEFKREVKEIVASKKYNVELVYRELKKLFVLKKHYLLAPTKKIRDKILEITNYRLYNDMTVEEVESAIEQIGVTSGLSQSVLNDDATYYLLSGETTLNSGIPLPFPILSSVFKGLRKGETMSYAMPSNSGKSRFTVKIAANLAFVHKKRVLIISNEMSEEKIRLCLLTTVINDPEIQKIHGQELHKTEGELLELKFRPDKDKKVEVDEEGFVLRLEGEDNEAFVTRLEEISEEYRKTVAVTEWIEEETERTISFIHLTDYTNDNLKKVILNYYYKDNIEYIFYDTLKADVDNIGNGEEVKKTATILSTIAQKFHVFIGSSMQLLESATLPVNLTVNDMSASKTAKEVLDTMCLIKAINKLTLKRYEISDTDSYEKCVDIEVDSDPDVRYYACVVDKNRAGAKPTVLFKLNLAYNYWEEIGHLKLKDEYNEI